MVYFLYTKQSPALKVGIKRLAKEFLNEEFNDFNFIKIDANETSIQEAVEECSYLPLGYEKKVVSYENCFFMQKAKTKNRNLNNEDINPLIQYIKHPNNDTLLIMSVNSSDIDEKSLLLAVLKENGKIIPPKETTEKEWNEFIASFFRDKLQVEIDNDAISELGQRTYCDQELLINTARKLSLYSNHITYDDIVLMVARPLEDKAFLIFNKLLEKKTGEAISIYRDLRVNNVEPVTLISQLANSFRLLNQVAYLNKQGYSSDSIAEKLNIKSGRAYVISKLIPLVTSQGILDNLEALYQLDLQIKSGQVDRFYAFELYLIEFKCK